MTLKKTLVTMFVLMLVQQSVRCDVNKWILNLSAVSKMPEFISFSLVVSLQKRNTFEITSVTCQFNEKYFADTLCEHHVNANGAKVVSGHLQLKQPLDTFEARVAGTSIRGTYCSNGESMPCHFRWTSKCSGRPAMAFRKNWSKWQKIFASF